jgi:hypothetical protein
MTRGVAATWRGLIAYLALTFGLSWAAQVTLVTVSPRLSVSPGLGGLATLTAAAALMWPPAIGAFVARRWIEGSGFTDTGLQWPRWPYLALAWLGPPALSLISVLLSLPVYPLDRNLPPSARCSNRAANRRWSRRPQC